jgi:hypothetical protein
VYELKVGFKAAIPDIAKCAAFKEIIEDFVESVE